MEGKYLFKEYVTRRTIPFQRICKSKNNNFQRICNWKNNSFSKNMQLEKKPVSDNAV
jgi:hypothetical protein